MEAVIEEEKEEVKIEYEHDEPKKIDKSHFDVKLNDYTVKFPFDPYDIQKEYMANVLQACSNSQNALLESATGTGKTLSLL